MKRPTLHLVIPTLALAISLPAPLGAQEVTEYGPQNGTVVISLWGSTNGTGIIERFIALGGGAEEGRFVIVPTAGGNYDGDGNIRVYDEDRVLTSWRDRGLKNVSMLQTHDPRIAYTEEFVATRSLARCATMDFLELSAVASVSSPAG